jgi:pyruvate/2-oxoglutarate dehydrogenase complex dihydrolipoamide acyltransferase (E2) component
MRSPIVVPDLRIGIEPLRISGWLAEEGDFVIAGESIVEILIPGVTFDILAESTGRLVQIVKSVDTSIAAGEVIGWLDDEAFESEPSYTSRGLI